MNHQITTLADQPQYAEQLARWYFDYWVVKNNPDGYDEVLAKVMGSTLSKKLPFTVLALEQGALIGAAEVKFHDNSGDKVWLDGVYVEPNHRGKGLALELVTEAKRIACELGVTQLYLTTRHLDGGLYVQAGFKAVERLMHRDEEALMMLAELSLVQ